MERILLTPRATAVRRGSIVCDFRHWRIITGLLVGLLALSLTILACEVCWARSGSAHNAPVYAVAALRAHLDRDPGAWLRRPVRVRAIPALRWCFAWMTPGPICQLWEPALVSTDGARAVEPLPLAWGSAPPLLAVLRQAPLLGAITPAPQAIHWAAPGIYRVQIQVTTCFSQGTALCYAAQVLDSSS